MKQKDSNINKYIDLIKYNNPDKYIVGRSMISFYSEKRPQTNENGVEVCKQLF